MSSILKALEKVEQERNARHEGPLGRFQKERERRRPWLLPLCVVGGAGAAALATFAVMGGFSGRNAPAKVAAPVAQAPAPPAVPAPVQLPAPAAAPLPVEVVATPAVQVEQPSKALRQRPAAAPVQQPLSVTRQEARPAAGQGTAVREVVRVAAPPSRRKGGEAAAKASGHGTPAPAAHPAEAAAVPGAPAQPAPHAAEGKSQIRVTGIAWQKDSGTSVAMINGRQVYEGEAVEGSRVKEILQDRVRFVTASGGTFEVPLGAGE